MDDPKRFGVYPSGDRNALYVTGGNPLPMNEWGSQFAENMPDDILLAIKSARAGGSGTVTDSAWRDRLAERFGARWRILRLRTRRAGQATVQPTTPGTTARTIVARKVRREGGAGGGSGGRSGDLNTGRLPGFEEASKIHVAGGIRTTGGLEPRTSNQGCSPLGSREIRSIRKASCY